MYCDSKPNKGQWLKISNSYKRCISFMFSTMLNCSVPSKERKAPCDVHSEKLPVLVFPHV